VGQSARNFRGENMQNLAPFRLTSNFDGEYLRNGWRYSKSVSYSIDSDFSGVRRKKSGELWFTTSGDLDVELYPPKSTFLEDHISAPGGAAHQIFTRAILLVLPHRGPGSPLQFSL